MTTNNNLDYLFADAEVPFGHPGRNFDNTPAYFDHSPITGQGPEPDYTPDEPDPIVHYAPGDRPLCGNESMTAVYTDEPDAVAGCDECLEPRRRGPAGPQRLPRPLPSLPAGDHRPGAGWNGAGRSGGPARTADGRDGDVMPQKALNTKRKPIPAHRINIRGGGGR